MDEQRLRAYLTLIQELLRCPSGEELALLKEHSDLLDADFIKIMEHVANQAEEQGAQGAAYFLRNLAQQLKEAVEQASENLESNPEDRYSAYIKLIETLLNCPSGSEAEVLRKNQELIDRGFILKVTQVAGMLEEIGEERAANFLQNIAAPLAEGLITSLPPDVSKSHIDFLAEALRITSNSNANPKMVYPLLQNNLDKLNLTLAKAITEWVKDITTRVQPPIAQSIAVDIVHFSILIQRFPLGNHSDNLEIAVSGYHAALTIFERDRFPEQWAGTHNNLGNAYVERVQGDRSDNLEQAIASYKAAAEVYGRDRTPDDWAMVQNNLGTAYFNRILDEKAENIEVAIECYLNALQIYQRELTPYKWAAIQFNLGNAYSDRIFDDREENIELAIEYYLAALEVYQRERTPNEWAMVQYNLGNTYRNRIRGDEAENLDSANRCYLAALEIYKNNQLPPQE